MEELFYTAADGARIAYYKVGSGEPLLCLHGSGQSKEQWLRTGWLDQLAERYTVLAPDQRGFGHSTVFHTPAGYALQAILGDFTGILRDCGFAGQEFRLLGHSYGATVGAQAIRAGLPIRRAVFGSGSMGASFFEKLCPAQAEEYRLLAAHKQAGTLDALPGYSAEDLEFVRQEDMEKFAALFAAWSRWQPVSLAELGGKAALYTGDRDYNREAVEAATTGRVESARQGLATLCFAGLNHGDLVERREICQAWVLEQLA